MRRRVVEVMEKLSSNGWAEELKKHSVTEERYQKLFELLPEILECNNLLIRNQMIFHIQDFFGIDLSVCRFYSVDDHRQYCLHDGNVNECTCIIPQLQCVLRDKNKETRSPGFF